MPIYWNLLEEIKGDKKIYVETGSLEGNSVEKALEAKYDVLHTIDADPHYYNFCKDKFKNNGKVTCHLGNSTDVLKELLPTIKESCVIYLDAHFGSEHGEYTPLMSELNVIKDYGNKNNTIAIDDIRLLQGTGDQCQGQIPYTKQQIEDKLKEINPNYEISYHKGFVENDILVAKIPIVEVKKSKKSK